MGPRSVELDDRAIVAGVPHVESVTGADHRAVVLHHLVVRPGWTGAQHDPGVLSWEQMCLHLMEERERPIIEREQHGATEGRRTGEVR